MEPFVLEADNSFRRTAILEVPVACGVAEKTASPTRSTASWKEASLLTTDIANP